MSRTILLINPPGFNLLSSEGGQHNLRATEIMACPPMSLLYLTSHLSRERTDIRIIIKDYMVKSYSADGLRELLRDEKPFLVGVTCFSTNLYEAFSIAKIVKEDSPSTTVIAGGPHTALFPQETISQPFIDLLCEGEGEKAFAEAVERLLTGKALTGIPNLWIKSEGRPIPPESYKAAYEDLDEMPFTDQSYVGVERYYHPFLYNDGGLIVVATARGCPFRCTYCNSAGRKARLRSIRSIVDEIQAKVERFHVRNVFLLDDTFNISSGRVQEFTSELRKRGISIDWGFRGRAHGLDEQTIKAAKETGLAHISIGVEDFTDEGMRLIRKGVTLDEVRQAFHWCNRYGIRTTANFIIGLPHNQDWDKQMGIYPLIKELSPTTIQTFVLLLIPGSELYEEAIRLGVISKDVWMNQARNPSPRFSMPGWHGTMSIEEQYRFNSQLNKWFYLRPGYILRQFLDTRSFAELARKARVGTTILKTALS
jgi:radical SAM superfamily enzyme YgiQ (UPF0313 family)